jgi:hypothetical protein
MKHTHGPLAAKAELGEDAFEVVVDYEIPGREEPVILATVFHEEDGFGQPAITREQALANARLYAASADLLDIAMKLAKRFPYSPTWNYSYKCVATAADIRELWSAIEKALGEPLGLDAAHGDGPKRDFD